MVGDRPSAPPDAGKRHSPAGGRRHRGRGRRRADPGQRSVQGQRPAQHLRVHRDHAGSALRRHVHRRQPLGYRVLPA